LRVLLMPSAAAFTPPPYFSRYAFADFILRLPR
jgi:hypothetical protein